MNRLISTISQLVTGTPVDGDAPVFSGGFWVSSPRPAGYMGIPWRAGLYYSFTASVAVNGAADTHVATANRIYATPIWVPNEIAITKVGIAINTGAGSNTRLMMHRPGSDGLPGALLHDYGLVATNTAGDKEIVVAQTLPVGLLWQTCIPDAALTFYTMYPGDYQIIGNPSFGNSGSGSPFRNNGSQSAPNPFGAIVSTDMVGSGRWVRMWVKT